MNNDRPTAHPAPRLALLVLVFVLLTGGPLAACPAPDALRAPHALPDRIAFPAASGHSGSAESSETDSRSGAAAAPAIAATPLPPHPRRHADRLLDTVTAHRSPTVARDSLDFAPSERNSRLYDSIRTKTSRRAVPRLLYRMLFRRPAPDSVHSGRAVDESRALRVFSGTTVGSIRIVRSPIFGPGGNWFERAGDRIHLLTRERVIRRDLLFRPGDRFDPELVVRNKQLLRSRPYLSDADIEVRRDPLDSTRVDLTIRTRDSWSVTVDGALHDRGRTMIGLYDANLLGTGNLFRIKTHFDRGDFSYGGNIFEYEIPNVLGTFFTADFSAGRDFCNSELRTSLSKELLRPTDYAVGIAYGNVKRERRFVEPDTQLLVRVRDFDLWGGYSRHAASIRSSLFVTARYDRARFVLRPPVAADLHPALHDRDLVLLSAGLYREKFYTANMVRGFGTREYLATGYRAELTGGRSWGEFGDALYLGLHYSTGGFRPHGYFMAGFTLGSYIDLSSGMWRRSAVDVDLRWFSNLYALRRSRLRQFLGIDYTQGWNRASGADEVLRFTRENGLQALDERCTGTTRAVLNTETVLFTPYQPLGFRIALFGFADFGTIGFSPNLFKNAFFTTFGIGIRLRNERLIFNTVQIRLGLAAGKGGWAGSDYLRVSNSRLLDEQRYRPTRPTTVAFE